MKTRILFALSLLISTFSLQAQVPSYSERPPYPTPFVGYYVVTNDPIHCTPGLTPMVMVGAPPQVPVTLKYCSFIDTWTTVGTGSGGITALTGDVTATGPGPTSSTVTRVNGTSVPLSAPFLGSNGSGQLSPLTATAATALLNPFSSSLQGTAPASGGGTSNFLRADGTWTAPAGTNGITALTGDVTAAGPGSASSSVVKVNGAALPASAVFAATNSSSQITALTATQATAMLNPFTSSLQGATPASGGGTTNFLRADGAWAAPPGGGAGGITALTGDVIATGPGSTASTVTRVNSSNVPTSAAFVGTNVAAQLTGLTAAQATALLIPASPANAILVNGGGTSIVNYAALTFDGSTLAYSKTSGRASLTTSSNVLPFGTSPYMGGLNSTIVEPNCQTPSSGNVQGGICSQVWLGGLFNPAAGGNLVGNEHSWIFVNGFNAADNSNKDTLSGMLDVAQFQAAGQKFGGNHYVRCNGSGDCGGAEYNVISAAFSGPAIGDEGLLGSNINFFEAGNLVQVATTGIARTSCSTTITQSGGVAQSTSATDVKTFSVGSTAGCNVGDWVTLDQGIFESTDTAVENEQITAVGGGALSMLIRHPHAQAAPVTPAAVVAAAANDLNNPYADNTWGQNRIVVDLTASPYVTGTATVAVGSQTVTGAGTTWTNTMVGGNGNLPGCIAFAADNVTTAPFSGGNPLVSWFPIQAVGSTTSLTLSRQKTGVAISGGAFTIRPCAQIGALALSYAATGDTITGLVLSSNSFPWTVGHTIENTISPYANIEGGVQVANQSWYGPWHTYDSLFRAADFSTGPGIINSAYRVVPSGIDAPGIARYSSLISLEANAVNVGINVLGHITGGIGLAFHDSSLVFWNNGTDSGDVGPVTGTGQMEIRSHAGKTRFTNGSNGTSLVVDDSGFTGNHTWIAPDTDGTICLTTTCSGITALTGDVTATGPGSTAASVVKVNGAAIPASATFLASNGSNQITGLTATTATAALNTFSSSLQGVVPASGGGTTNFMRADGTWASPGSGIADTTVAVTGATQGANSCSSPATVSMTGLTTAMVVLPGYSSDPTALTGWGSTAGMVFQAWPSGSNTASWIVCNQTASPITYSSVTFNLGAR